MSNRSGFALLAALWLVVAIATVALGLGLEARERRAGGFTAAERTAARAAAAGALAVGRARLEQALRRRPSIQSGADVLRAADPWLDADSLFRDTLAFGGLAVHLEADDLGAKLDLNAIGGERLRNFLSFILKDYGAADALAQAIDDWRDRDDLAKPRGAERDDYLAQRRLDLPPNRPFRDIDELRLVEGMTPEHFAAISPYLMTSATASNGSRIRINVNAAPEPVLRAVPQITEPVITRILSARSQGRRIQSLSELLPSQISSNSGARKQWEESMDDIVTLVTTDVELVATVFAAEPARPWRTRLRVERRNDGLRVRR